MKRVLVSGVALAVLAAIAVLIGASLNIALGSTLFAGAIGAVLGLVPDRSPLARIGGFLIGFVIAWVMYGIQAQFLPQINVSNAIMTLVTIIIVTIIAALAHNKIPFWSFLLGAAAISGAYGVQFGSSPELFLTQSVAAAGGVLFVAALGMVAAMLAEMIQSESSEPNIGSAQQVPQTAAKG